jgi:N utilization substance protein B
MMMTSSSPRRLARERIAKCLYQTEVCEDPLWETWENLDERRELPSDAKHYADELCRVLSERQPEIDALLRPHVKNWSFDRLGLIDREVMRLATAELLVMQGTPARVILDEAVDIAGKFGGEESGKFVNGILDQLARQLRPGELEGADVDRSRT